MPLAVRHPLRGRSSRAHVNVDADWLLSGRTAKLPKERVVLEILETVDISETLVRRCRALKAKATV